MLPSVKFLGTKKIFLTASQLPSDRRVKKKILSLSKLDHNPRKGTESPREKKTPGLFSPRLEGHNLRVSIFLSPFPPEWAGALNVIKKTSRAYNVVPLKLSMLSEMVFEGKKSCFK